MKSEVKPAMLNRKEVTTVTGISSTTIYNLEKAGKFPARKRLTHNRVGWRYDEVMDWINSRETLTIPQ